MCKRYATFDDLKLADRQRSLNKTNMLTKTPDIFYINLICSAFEFKLNFFPFHTLIIL